MTGGGSPKGCPQMPNLLRVRAIFRALPLPPLLLPSPLSSTSLLSNFSPPLPFPKAVNKKLSYRGRNAFSMIKTHESNNAYANILYLYVRQSRRIMFSICPFVRSSVRFFSFVCLLPTCEREWTFVWTDFNANWHKSPPRGARSWMIDLGVRRSKFKVAGGRSFVWKHGGDIILDPLNGVDRGVQWARKGCSL